MLVFSDNRCGDSPWQEFGKQEPDFISYAGNDDPLSISLAISVS